VEHEGNYSILTFDISVKFVVRVLIIRRRRRTYFSSPLRLVWKIVEYYKGSCDERP
jgi:hypothetical protein